MSNEQKATASFWHELFQLGLYKRSQGRITRQVTFAALAVTLAIGCWRLSETSMMSNWGKSMQYGAPLAIFALGIWFVYRAGEHACVCGFPDRGGSGDGESFLALAVRS